MTNPDSPESPRAKPTGPEPIPFAAVLTLFEQLTLAYGQPFLARWDGIEELGTVHEDWRYKLAGLTPQQLAWGLDHLQAGRPPEAMTFRQWCLAMPGSKPATALPPPRGKVTVPPQVREAINALLIEEPAAEPQRVRAARLYLEVRAGRIDLTPVEKEWSAFYRRLIERYESAQEDKLAAAKQRAQASVDQYQQEHGDGAEPQPAQR